MIKYSSITSFYHVIKLSFQGVVDHSYFNVAGVKYCLKAIVFLIFGCVQSGNKGFMVSGTSFGDGEKGLKE